MTKYRLKDRALQKQLDAISGGDFSEKLNTEALKRFSPVLAREVFTVYFGDFDALANRFSVIFELDEIEEVPEYDPHKWNPYPEVTPPECVPMRVEYRRPDETIGRCCSFFREGVWEDSEDQDLEIINVQRFRPWEAPDEEEKE